MKKTKEPIESLIKEEQKFEGKYYTWEFISGYKPQYNIKDFKLYFFGEESPQNYDKFLRYCVPRVPFPKDLKVEEFYFGVYDLLGRPVVYQGFANDFGTYEEN